MVELKSIYRGKNPPEHEIVEPGDPDYDPAQNVPFSKPTRAQAPVRVSVRGDVAGHDFHGNQWTGGFGGGGTSPKISGIGDVKQFIADHPIKAGERSYEWQARIVDGLTPEQKNEVLFQSREQYPPVKYLADGASQYRADHGLPEPKVDIADQRVNAQEAYAAGKAFEDTPDQSGDPKVQAAYADFKAQNDEQWHLLTDPVDKGGLGVKVDFVNNPEPYQSAQAQADDLRDNHHLSIATGLGGEHFASMTTEEYDQFRAVHDAFGHAAIGGGFDRHGEYQAWLSHETMYTGEGGRAMSTEYHGVNSALWSGAPENPGGTGKTILLPGVLSQSPWDKNGNLTRSIERSTKSPVSASDQKGIAYLVKALKLDGKFAQRYATPPWHPVPKSARAHEPVHVQLRGDVAGHDFHGNQWTGGIGGGGDQKGTGTKGDPIHTDDVTVAVKALGEGKYVELNQRREVSTLLNEITKMVDEAKAAGEKAKNYDLCRASVEGTNLFCEESKGIPRILMPQLSGVPTPGSWADENLTKNAKGEVDLGPSFVEHLQGRGVSVTDDTIPAEFLRASQNELNGVKVAGMASALEAGKLPAGPIFVTNDDYVVDGHHRWAANIAVATSTGSTQDMPVRVINMDILHTLAAANNFTDSRGLPHASVAQPALRMVIRLLDRLRGRHTHTEPPCIGCGDTIRVGDLPGHPFHGNQYTGGEGGGGVATAQAPAKLAIDNMLNALREPDGGFTIDPRSGDTPKTGFAVAIRGETSRTPVDQFFAGQPEEGRSIIKDWLRAHADYYDQNPNAMVGGWHDPVTHDIVLDPSYVVPDRSAAIKMGVDQNQQAIADLSAIHAGDWNNAFIDTGGTGRMMITLYGSVRGDVAGHAFHGNQWVSGESGGASSTPKGETVTHGTTFVTRLGQEPVTGPMATSASTKEAIAIANNYAPSEPYPSHEEFAMYADVPMEPNFEPSPPPTEWQPGSVEALSQSASDWQRSFEDSQAMQVAADALMGQTGGFFDDQHAAEAREMLTAMAGDGVDGAASAHALVNDVSSENTDAYVRNQSFGANELARGLDDPTGEIAAAFREAQANNTTVQWSMASFVMGGQTGEDRMSTLENISGDEPPSYDDPETGEETRQNGDQNAAGTALSYAKGGDAPMLIRASGTALNVDGTYEAVMGGEFRVTDIRTATSDERNSWRTDIADVPNGAPITVVDIQQVANVKLPPGVSTKSP